MSYVITDKCEKCGDCVEECPVEAISEGEDKYVVDPDTCVDKLREMKKRFGISEFALWFNIGGIAPEHVERGMRLAAEKVLPHLR